MSSEYPELPNQDFTVEELIEDTEGRHFESDPNKDHYLCDWCAIGVPFSKEPRVAGYMADWVPDNHTPSGREINDNRWLTGLATYCEECSMGNLLFPTRMATEVRTKFTITEDREVVDVEVTDVSPEGDGIPWNPRELMERITQVDYREIALLSSLSEHMVMGPENIVTQFNSAVENVDIRNVVDWKGEIDPKALGRARKEYEQFKERRSGKSRKQQRREFRDRVRGEGQ